MSALDPERDETSLNVLGGHSGTGSKRPPPSTSAPPPPPKSASVSDAETTGQARRDRPAFPGDGVGPAAAQATGVAGVARRPDEAVPRPLRRFLALDDFVPAARQRLPRQIYGYYAGAAETNQSRDDNRRAFRDIAFVPTVLADVSRRSTAATLFGQPYRFPFGISPMGLSGLACFEGDLVLARAARAEAIPMVVSATSIMRLERLAAEGGARWFQAYLPGEPERIAAMVDRVAAAGFDTFVLTVDVPVPANRENNTRTGFSIPLRPSLRLLLDGLTHPDWSVGTFARTLRAGMPHMENMDAHRGPPILSRDLVRAVGKRDGLSWDHVDLIRRRWRGRFVLKGVLSAADAAEAARRGVDAVWVSNHGGRQLDGALAPLHALPAIKAAAGAMTVLFDSGVRRGTDVLKALALGADFVFLGRPFLFAAAAAGEAGVRHAVGLLGAEVERDMALLGVTDVGTLGPQHLCDAHPRLGSHGAD
ncbi:alpha-hydroxy-acid oxidizing protein [Lichenibacterium ramalinae]|uniref:Alpha-hydroxy-acid oxidizing protein n=1 Tax=Lichenibacterium ramalinae TaxID=2316527 RepID=A0A4Q2RGJ7_9HYPH|nr:alpha-hydroxy-acid oxidizing protein [Lichenibacterium ramalinae]